MLYLLPFIVLTVASIYMLRLPRGTDFLVPIFFIPWTSLQPDIGFGMKVSEALMLLLIVRHVSCQGLLRLRLPGYPYLLSYTLLGVLGAYLSIEFGPDVPKFLGGPLRNGYGRVVVTLVKYAIVFIFIAMIISERRRIRPFVLLNSYIASCLVLGGLGLVQFTVFMISGVDLFPMRMLSGDGFTTSATLASGANSYIRINSFAGEPKALGQAAALAVVLLVVLGHYMNWRVGSRTLATLALLVVVLLSFSTSAAVLLAVSFGLAWFFSRSQQPLSRHGVALVLVGLSLLVFSVYYYVAATTETLLPHSYTSGTHEGLWELLQHRFIGRIRLDDSDALIMESLVNDPLGVAFGRGIGLAHHFAFDLLPVHMERYLGGKIIPAKSGIGLFVGDVGLVGLLLIALFAAHLIPSRRSLFSLSSGPAQLMVSRIQAISIGLYGAMLLRLYVFESVWIVFALAYAIIYSSSVVLKERPGEPRSGSRAPGFAGPGATRDEVNR